MILKNAKIFDEDFRIIRADVSVSGQKIDAIAPELAGDGACDLSGCLIAPGFVDIHTHGCAGADTSDGTREAVETMAGHLVTKGVTSFCPTTMTLPMEQIETALSVIRDCMEHPPEGAAVLGANMEGPYISPNRRGAQMEQYVHKPDFPEFRKVFEACGGIVKLVNLAPECEGGLAFAEQASKICRVTLAHTEADYDQAKEAFRHGVTHVTHLFNAMNGIHHRKPGAVGAVFDDERVRAELVCDGYHIHPAVLRMAFRILGEDRTVLISDSMRAAGLPDGTSELGGQQVFVKDGMARLADGTIAGSTTNLYDEVKNLIRFGIPLRQAIKSATINPALAIGEAEKVGSIRVGKYADLVVLDDNFDIRMVIAKGRVPVRTF